MSHCSQTTLGDVFRKGFSEYMQNNNTIPLEHYKVASSIINCQTPALGGRLYKCDECDHTVPLFNSCRNRHCPQCQAMSRAKWVEKRNKELLPTSYYHIVFTIPEQLNPFALRNKSVFYNILFKAASETLIQMGANSSFLGGTIGFITILHTWTHCAYKTGTVLSFGRTGIPYEDERSDKR
jgi:hypothetical protein